jgi:hypothetical protein
LLCFIAEGARSKKTKAWLHRRFASSPPAKRSSHAFISGYATPSLLAAFGRHAIACLIASGEGLLRKKRSKHAALPAFGLRSKNKARQAGDEAPSLYFCFARLLI